MSFVRRNHRLLQAYWRYISLGEDHTDTWTLMFPKYRIAYIPIPKAANSSIRSSMLPLLGIEPDTIDKIQYFRGFDKRRFSECAPEIEDDWFVFTVVRNPLARIASAYQNKVVGRQQMFTPFKGMGLTLKDNFRTFVTAISRWPKPMLNDHVMPQTMLLSSALCLQGLKVYKVEELATDWPRICHEIGARSGIRLGELALRNTSGEGWSWRSLYDQQTKAIVSRIYAADLSKFGYSDS